MKAIDKLAKAGHKLEISTLYDGRVSVSFCDCWVQKGIALTHERGFGKSVNKAAKNYLSMIKGETLVFNPWNKTARKEIVFKL